MPGRESPPERVTIDYHGRTWTGTYSILVEKGGIETLTVDSDVGSKSVALHRGSSPEWLAKQLLRELVETGY